MNNLDEDLKTYFKIKLENISPPEELKNKIFSSIEEEKTQKGIFYKIRSLLNKEIEIPIAAIIVPLVLICILPVAFSIYYKEQIAPVDNLKIEEILDK